MRSPWVVGQPSLKKLFWAACLCFVQDPAGSPAGGRFPESSRPAGAAVGCGRVGWRARAGQPARGFCVWWAFAPARRERPREAGWRRRRVPLCVARGHGVFRFEASESNLRLFALSSLALLLVLGTLQAIINTEEHIASKQTPRSTTTPLRCNKDPQQPCSPEPPER